MQLTLIVIGGAVFYGVNYGGLAVPPPMVGFAIKPILLSLSISALILAVCLVRSQRIVWLLSPLRYLGAISYGIYLWHLIVIMLLKGRVEDPQIFFVLTAIESTGLATLSWYLFERPIITLSWCCQNAASERLRKARPCQLPLPVCHTEG